MKTALRSIGLAVATAALLACSPSGDPALAEEAGGATSAPAAAAPEVNDANYELSMSRLQQWRRAAENVQRAVQQRPELEETISIDASASVQQTAARWEREPAIRAAVEEAGLSVREYTAIMMSLLQGLMAQGALEQGYVEGLPPEINARNAAFVREHRAEIQRVFRELEESAPDAEEEA